MLCVICNKRFICISITLAHPAAQPQTVSVYVMIRRECICYDTDDAGAYAFVYGQ